VATLAGCEMGLKLMGAKIAGSGVSAAMDYFSAHKAQSTLQKVA
jgi:alanine-glyoxylate transaminase/serine-glyoxylate transaminase/serine-pyruvate transaminase